MTDTPIKLERWAVVPWGGPDPYQPPECVAQHLHGVVTGHPKKPDGSSVMTSYIVGIEGELVRTYSGSLYELGEVDPAYEAKFPGARRRLLSQESR